MAEKEFKGLRQTNPNEVFIEGWLNKKSLQIKNLGKGNFISGKIEVRTDENNIIPVEVYATEYVKDKEDPNKQKPNSIYIGLKTVMDEHIDATQVDDWRKADKVRINSAQVRVNEWVKDGQILSAVKYNSNFISRVTDDTFKPQGIFKTEVITRKLRAELKDNEETGKGYLDAYIVDYNGVLRPISFATTDKVWKGFQKKLEEEGGETLLVWGNLISTVEVIRISTEAEFGEDEDRVITRPVKQRVIIGASLIDNESTYDEKDIKKALKAKEKEYEKMKSEADSKKLFNGKEDGDNDDDDIGDDLPF